MGTRTVGTGWGWGQSLRRRGGDGGQVCGDGVVWYGIVEFNVRLDTVGDGDRNHGDGWGWGRALVPMQLSYFIGAKDDGDIGEW